MNRAELIRKLQQPKQYCFGMLETEEKELINELKLKGVCQYFSNKKWCTANYSSGCTSSYTYRISPDYKEEAEPEYEISTIEWFQDDYLKYGYCFFRGSDWLPLKAALDLRFAGIQFEGQSSRNWYMFLHGWIDKDGLIFNFQHGGHTLAVPKRVRFLKGE